MSDTDRYTPRRMSHVERIARALASRRPSEIELPVDAQAAVAVILAQADGASALELLLIQRAERANDPWSGHMALPGGRRDPEDADLRATAVRETREEIGMELASARLLGRLDDLRPIRQSERKLAVRPFVWWSREKPALQLSEEVARALWVPLDALREAAGESEVEHRGSRLRVPAFLIEDRVVWGMTQRVVAELLLHAQS